VSPHTCVEATVRFAAELGYEVTVVSDATAVKVAAFVAEYASRIKPRGLKLGRSG
jgi:nicotinamidase-related amidase